MAKVGIPLCLTREAATSSCVERGFEAQTATWAPPALRVMARLAVSLVTCRQAETRWPRSGFSRAKRLRIADSTGIWLSAHSMRALPAAASPRSLTSCFMLSPGAAARVVRRGEGALSLREAAQGLDLVRPLPRELGLAAAEVP